MKNMIPCVGFELQYSPLERNCVDNLAHSLHNRSNSFVFEVIQEVQPGQDILVAFSNRLTPTQHLLAIVRHCHKLSNDHYRITLVTQPGARIHFDNIELICLPIIRGIATAMEMTIVCPSCHKNTPFRFIANQDGDWETGILPIYNCSSCGTTRAMIGMVA